MKQKRLIQFILTSSLLVTFASNFISFNTHKIYASSNEPKYETSLVDTINLSRNTNEEIRAYYSSLDTLDIEERKGTNLLKNLKPILQDMSYFSYQNIWKIYEITDREWELSPANETTYGTYDATNNIIKDYEYGSNSEPKNDPYVKTLYRNRDDNGVTVSEGRIKEWGNHSGDNATNREHIWCQSRGFKAESGAEGPAGTDLHHLRSGDAYINTALHNDNPYGYVDKNNITKDGKDKHDFLSGNYVGIAKNTSAQDESNIVFEPQDEDKGDIARAIFYMVACYNNLSGTHTITQFNPNLTIVDYIYNAKKSVTSSETNAVSMSKLSDLLEWHKLDPVDEFEIYRNDLIYNNYQHNRNPFIDFPSWVDVIWGNADAYATSQTDIIHGSAINVNNVNVNVDLAKSNTFTLKATTINNSDVTWVIEDTSILSATKLASASNEEITFTALKEGTTKIIVKTNIDGVEHSVTVNVNVTKGFVLETWMIVVIAIVFIIILIIIIVSKKARKKAKRYAKKKMRSYNKK